MAHELAERQNPMDPKLALSSRRTARRALRFILIPVALMAVLAVVTFDGDWTYMGLTAAMILVVMGMMYLDRLRTQRLLPPAYRGLVREVLARDGANLAEPDAARDAMERLARIQEEMDAMQGRDSGEIDGVSPTVAVWAGGLGVVLWLVAAGVALVVGELRGALLCVVMSAFFGGLTWFTVGERRKRRRAMAILEEEMARVRRGTR